MNEEDVPDVAVRWGFLLLGILLFSILVYGMGWTDGQKDLQRQAAQIELEKYRRLFDGGSP